MSRRGMHNADRWVRLRMVLCEREKNFLAEQTNEEWRSRLPLLASFYGAFIVRVLARQKRGRSLALAGKVPVLLAFNRTPVARKRTTMREFSLLA